MRSQMQMSQLKTSQSGFH